jgi:hypothetical protein
VADAPVVEVTDIEEAAPGSDWLRWLQLAKPIRASPGLGGFELILALAVAQYVSYCVLRIFEPALPLKSINVLGEVAKPEEYPAPQSGHSLPLIALRSCFAVHRYRIILNNISRVKRLDSY